MGKFSQLAKLASTALVTAVATLGLTSPTALAGPGAGSRSAHSTTITWTVSPGGAFSGKSGTATFKDTATGFVITCASATMAGKLKSGSGLPGKRIGTVTSLTFVKCTSGGVAYTMSSGPVTWSLNAHNFQPGVMGGTITGIHFTFSSNVCSAVVDGTSGTAGNGSVKVVYSDTTGNLKISPKGGNLHIFNVSGCTGVLSDGGNSVGNGDPGALSACVTVTPKQSITADAVQGMIGPPCQKP
jgi:hypothetical protein